MFIQNYDFPSCPQFTLQLPKKGAHLPTVHFTTQLDPNTNSFGNCLILEVRKLITIFILFCFLLLHKIYDCLLIWSNELSHSEQLKLINGHERSKEAVGSDTKRLEERDE